MFCYRLFLFFFIFVASVYLKINKTPGSFMHLSSHSFSLPGPTASLFPAEPTAPVLAADSSRSLQCGQVKPGEGELGVWTMPSFPACWVNAKLEVSWVLCFRITENTEPLFWGEMVSLSFFKSLHIREYHSAVRWTEAQTHVHTVSEPGKHVTGGWR